MPQAAFSWRDMRRLFALIKRERKERKNGSFPFSSGKDSGKARCSGSGGQWAPLPCGFLGRVLFGAAVCSSERCSRPWLVLGLPGCRYTLAQFPTASGSVDLEHLHLALSSQGAVTTIFLTILCLAFWARGSLWPVLSSFFSVSGLHPPVSDAYGTRSPCQPGLTCHAQPVSCRGRICTQVPAPSGVGLICLRKWVIAPPVFDLGAAKKPFFPLLPLVIQCKTFDPRAEV